MGAITVMIMLIVWTWGLTPVWVNIMCTVLSSLIIILKYMED